MLARSGPAEILDTDDPACRLRSVRGAALAVVSLLTRRAGALLASIWLVYAGYEYLMVKRVLFNGECNIRVDLLLIAPVLVFGTPAVLAALAWHAVRARRQGKSGA
jgi:hypothetical protein